MKDLFLITDSAGALLFRNRKVPKEAAIRAGVYAAIEKKSRGLLPIGQDRAYVKEVALQGRRLLFFMDFDSLCTRFGIHADRVADRLFDLAALADEERRTVRLGSLYRILTEQDTATSGGVRIALRAPATSIAVHVPPQSLLLAVTLLARLSAGADGKCRLRAVEECGRVTLFADGTGESDLASEERILLTVLLHEVAAAAGFAVDQTKSTGGVSLSLALSPLGDDAFGLKTEAIAFYRKMAACYRALFW